ncbi:MAG: bifunctional 23S rRNA (guanine(2069)-N(7))-methyltransferase RlmK/23S rRNA (guanine(2445)-N(2))-methyltransferase RlmL [Gammaproteobacteria bacterium]
MTESHALFATAPKGLTSLLLDELRALGAAPAKETPAGVSFEGALEMAYRACLWSRFANRILLPLARFPAPTPEALYAGVRSIPWAQHMAPSGTLAVDANTGASAISHSQYAALKLKDAVVDQFRDAAGVRPSVDVERPDLRINLYLFRDQATVSVDLSGDSLHRRGYRRESVLAPLKENLAAAILMRAGWPEVAADGGALVDPMCGSGTLPIEAALMAGDIAPGLLRPYFGFEGWLGHRVELWQRLLEEADERRARGIDRIPPIHGYDADAAAVRATLANIEAAGLRGKVHAERRDLAHLVPVAGRAGRAGLVVVNPPYGQRLGDVESLRPLYAQLGTRLREHFTGWRAAVFTGNPELAKGMGLRARRQHALFNGAIPCKLLHFEVEPQWFVAVRSPASPPRPLADAGAGGEMFANRVRKNLRQLRRWAAREGVCCYRVYDADMPEYALAVDLYRGDSQWVHVQEYAAPASIDPERARLRLREALTVLPDVLEVPRERVYFKVRRRQKGQAQYERLDEQGEFHEVREGACRLLVNFTDYLDTGLFLDHRLTRHLVGELAAGRRFLNLFAYTGAATVHAVLGGASASTTVDMSNTYLEWARRNFDLNGISGPEHELVRADCLQWLERQAESGRRRYGLIFLDPPTYSSSKRMASTFDVQRDHVALIRQASRLLTDDGVLIFSNNFRRFRMDADALSGLRVRDISADTLPRDFARNPRIHNCWRITLEGS